MVLYNIKQLIHYDIRYKTPRFANFTFSSDWSICFDFLIVQLFYKQSLTFNLRQFYSGSSWVISFLGIFGVSEQKPALTTNKGSACVLAEY